MKYLTLIICLLSLSKISFSQEGDTSTIRLINRNQGIESDSTMIQTITILQADFIRADCAHGHICCAVGCGCCEELNRQQIYDTIYSPVKNGVRRITVVERYRYANSNDLQAVHYRFRKGSGKWSEKYYPVHIHSGLDYKRIDKKFGQYPNEAESNYAKENQVLVYTATREYLLIDLEGNQVAFKVHGSTKLTENLYLSSVLVGTKQLYCFTPTAGTALSRLKYSSVDSFNDEGFAIVHDIQGYSGLVDKTGREVVPCVYSRLTKIGPDRYSVSPIDHNDYSIINSNGKTITTELYGHMGEYSDGLVFAKQADDLLVYLDINGKEVIQLAEGWGYDFNDGMAAVMHDPGEPGGNDVLWGFIDKTGKLVIDYQFYRVYDFQNGAAPVCTGKINGEVWKVIDKTGKMISPTTYTNMEPFKGGIAKIIIGGKGFGFIDTTGRELMPCIYSGVDNGTRDSWEFDGKIIRSTLFKDSTLELVDRYGKQILDLHKYRYANFIPKNYDENTFYPFIQVLKYNQLLNLIDLNGKELLADDYSHFYIYSDDIAVGHKGDEQFLISLTTGKVIKTFGTLRIANISNGIVSVLKENEYYRYEFYDLEGKRLKEY